MIHRTFRSLDDAPKLVGFTIRQWAALIGASTIVLALVDLAHLPAKPAITLFVFAVGLPAALTYVSESGGLQLGVLVRDIVRWRVGAKSLRAASPADRSSRGVVVAAARERVEALAEEQPKSRRGKSALSGRSE